MENDFLSDLSQDIGQLFFTGDNYDLIIRAGEDQNVKEFFAHSLILSARSTYFKAALSNKWAKKENGIIIFNKPNISPEIIELVLIYLYTGNVNLDKKSGREVLNFLIATDELGLQKLGDYIQTYLVNNQKEYLRDDFTEILQVAFRNEGYEDLRKFYILEKPKILFKSPKFISLEKDLVIFFLIHDELDIEEIEIWNSVVKWALTRMSTQQNINNLSQWTPNDFGELEDILHDLIPHIRWFQIPANIFWKKVNPFEPIFPKQLYRDIVGYNCDHSTPQTNVILPLRLNSILINGNHFLIITSWIDKKEKTFYNTKNTPYSFKLLYRASRDGFEAAKFHELCDNKGPTVMISKLEENGRLVGGYNPLSWEPYGFKHRSLSWKRTPDSFLFTFTKKEDIDSAFITRVRNNDMHGVCYNIKHGPAFGGGRDVFIINNKIRSNNYSSYLETGGIVDETRKDYILEDYEVFQIAKKQEQQ